MASPSPPSHRLKSLQLTSSPPQPPPATSSEEEEAEDQDQDLPSPALPPHSQQQPPQPPTEEQRVAALQQELQLLKTMNATLTNLHTTLSVSKTNLQTLQMTISSSAVLLDTWTRILSQAEHNARLIADPGWEGASEDAAMAEREEVERKVRLEREREERELRERERAMSAATPVDRAPAQRGRLTSGRGLRGSMGGRRAVGNVGGRGTNRGRGRA